MTEERRSIAIEEAKQIMVRYFATQMEQFLEQPEYNNAGTPTQLAIDLGKKGYIKSFADFETVLRQI